MRIGRRDLFGCGVAAGHQDLRVVTDQELSADCMAAEMLARHGRRGDAAIMVERFFRSGFYSPGAGYPSGLQRSLIVRQCGAVTGPRDRLAADGISD